MFELTRRNFMKGCCAAAMASPAGRALGYVDATATATQDTLVVVFLRGAMDGLSFLPPGSNSAHRAAYEQARPSLKIPLSGTGAGLVLGNDTWRLHPRAAALQTLYAQGHLALVVGAGQVNTPVTRSHFDAQANLESGLGGQQSGVGWLTRHLLSAGLPTNVPVPAVAMGSLTPTSLLASTEAITMGSGSDFRLDTFHWSWANDDAAHNLVGAVNRVPALWSASGTLESAGRQALDSLALLRPINFGAYDAATNPGGYQPAGGANYGTSNFGTQLRNVAQMVKGGLGLRIATLDLGGWDTHDGQGSPINSYDYFGNQVQALSDGLSAFYTDLAGSATNYMQQVSVVVLSEFGRRVNENDSGGTDHGYGNVMLALGGKVNGGAIYGSFPGLAPDQLFEGADVAVTTDYRRLLSEALIRRLGNPNVYYAFPGYSGYSPLGVFQGTDLPPTDFDRIFANGFN